VRDSLAFSATARENALPDRTDHVLVVVLRDGVVRHRLRPGQTLRIGRSESSDVVVPDGKVSRDHLTLYVGETFEIYDHGSHNGTWVRRERVPANRRVPVAVGDPIQLGASMLIVQVAPCETHSGASQASDPGGERVVRDPAMLAIYDLVQRAAAGKINVLITGETGSGKEIIAETLHQKSAARRRGPLVRINCAALPESLFESEVFGHERGAFTGALRAKPGLLETAHDGTAFLDEVGELSLVSQAKLLRVLESREVTRVGGLTSKSIDVRFVAATNRDLRAEVARGKFREDLFFRLAGMVVAIPPLRQRPSEIWPLVESVARTVANGLGRSAPAFTAPARQALEAYSWPGNIRELRNVVECAVLRCDGASVKVGDLTLQSVRPDVNPSPFESAKVPVALPSSERPPAGKGADGERERIMFGLAACNGNQTRAAEYLQMPRRTLVAKLAAYGIPRPRKN